MMSLAQPSTRTCILHIRHECRKPLKAFDTNTWETVQATKAARLSTWTGSSKYTQVCQKLPLHYDDSISYHSHCYKDFTAVPKSKDSTAGSADPKVSTADNLSTLLRSQVDHPKTSTSGVFEAVCIFCNHERKSIKDQLELLGTCQTETAVQLIKDAAIML